MARKSEKFRVYAVRPRSDEQGNLEDIRDICDGVAIPLTPAEVRSIRIKRLFFLDRRELIVEPVETE